MRRLFAVILIALLLGVGVVALIETDPGYVLVTYSHYTLETSLWVGLLLLLGLILALYWTVRLFYRLLGGQRTFLSWLGNRKAVIAQRHTTRGVILYSEGNWERARRQLERGVEKNEAPLLNYLLAARAADQLHESAQAREMLRLADESDPRAKVAVEMTLAELRLGAGEYSEALAALKNARLNVARHPRVLDLLRQAYEGLGDWDAMLELLPDLKKHKRLSRDDYQALESGVHCQRLALAASGPNASSAVLATAWQQVPTRLKHEGPVLDAYVDGLVAVGDWDTAEQTILKALKQQWDPQLVRDFGLLEGDNTSKRLALAERWLDSHADDANLLICLGRLCARDKLWGKARDYFESAYRIEASPEVCAELGRLLTGLGEPKVAGAYFREGLLGQQKDLPELPVPSAKALPGA